MKTDRQIELMGIVNLTDDSYFAQSRCAGPDAALRMVAKMVEDGADIIDTPHIAEAIQYRSLDRKYWQARQNL